MKQDEEQQLIGIIVVGLVTAGDSRLEHSNANSLKERE
jgi:hypothetical protein